MTAPRVLVIIFCTFTSASKIRKLSEISFTYTLHPVLNGYVASQKKLKILIELVL